MVGGTRVFPFISSVNLISCKDLMYIHGHLTIILHPVKFKLISLHPFPPKVHQLRLCFILLANATLGSKGFLKTSTETIEFKSCSDSLLKIGFRYTATWYLHVISRKTISCLCVSKDAKVGVGNLRRDSKSHSSKRLS